MDPVGAPLLEVRGATKRYGSETVLDAVDFRLRAGEIHSLMGENGAGKSTLIKAITGALRLDAGEIRLDGDPVSFRTPHQAIVAGISSVYQEIDLLPNLTVAENVCLGREPRRFGVIDRATMLTRADDVLDSLGVHIDPASILRTHSLAVQQLVAIARAISSEVRVLVLDEPTSSLDADEVEELFRVMRELSTRGVAILFVSHFLDQVYEICDRVTVLRGGRGVGEYATSELLRVDLVEKMLGEAGVALIPSAETSHDSDAATPALRVRGLRSPTGIRDIDLDVAEGEVVGVAGLLGSGRSELARALTGVDGFETGEVIVHGVSRRFRSPRDAISHGVVYSSENRRTEGIIAELSVLENISLAVQAQRGILHPMGPARRRELAQSWIEALRIRPTDVDKPAGELSGGNQQKVLLARLLAAAPRILVLDEPTRGIDVGSKAELQRLVGELADNGLSVIYISAELDEVLRVSHTVIVVREGRIAHTLPSLDLDSETLLALVSRSESGEEERG
ncbi:sugar ABC transporter ATP-binding protein [Microbacterium sp. cx-59]|uniref:sugar ABC transporter ATP-binding protein n=1 Tax=Microbacterium sp. cx-59 TaxID=2891207 RepID=UPI001E45C55F|nr:sugar ABC transporter ATP-binding protein [Microbacterium sp. cx-59]MCC4908361.1 sugar ABC transporter ATP-binding protein [Microbacterium sp. cx-59]